MNCLIIECRTVVEQPRGLAPPLGLIVYDVPLFTWLVCERVGYYDSSLFRRREGWPYLTDCAVWMFDGAKRFRKGGRFRTKDRTFVIEYDLAAGEYVTERLALDDVLNAGAYDALTTRLPKRPASEGSNFGAENRVRRYRDSLQAWLASAKAKLDDHEHAAESGALGYPALEEE